MKFKEIIYALSMAVLFGACSEKEGDNAIDTGENKSVYLKMQLSKRDTRADEATATGTEAELLSALIYFLDGSTDPVIYNSYIAGNGGNITLAQLEAGYEFDNIPSVVTQVYVIGNYNSADQNLNTFTFPRSSGQRLSQIQEVEMNIQEVVYPRLSDGTASTGNRLLTVMQGRATIMDYVSGESTWGGDEPLTNGDKYADVTIAPVNSRFEIQRITYTGTQYTSFTLENIFINNYYQTATLSRLELSLEGAPLNNGSATGKYDPTNDTEFAYKYHTTLYDTIDEAMSPTDDTATPDNGRWAYHVFGNASPVPHIILRLTNVETTEGPVPDRFVTVKGFLYNSEELTLIRPNYIYNIVNLEFSDEDIVLIPEPEEISVWVHVQVQPWTTVNVIPVI